MGKTLLAKTILDTYSYERRYWISLRNVPNEQLDLHINEQLFCIHFILTGEWNLWELYNNGRISIGQVDEIAATTIGSNSLLIINAVQISSK